VKRLAIEKRGRYNCRLSGSGIRNFRTQDFPWGGLSSPGTKVLWNVRPLELSFLGTKIPWNFRSIELLTPATFY